ncbi:hypothetical protein [Microbacterium esteraromaticum]|uniref:hypothetical protein n=1 Tax=Microbacterium esteraromaticum TaxID=57043 RepID=UPI0021753231|nr:hypothetical protein [Microbacterium esteraromaticum]
MSASGNERAHAALVLNPVKVDAERLRSGLLSLSRAHGWAPPRFYETTIEDPGQMITRTALDEGAAAVLAAGAMARSGPSPRAWRARESRSPSSPAAPAISSPAISVCPSSTSRR